MARKDQAATIDIAIQCGINGEVARKHRPYRAIQIHWQPIYEMLHYTEVAHSAQTPCYEGPSTYCFRSVYRSFTGSPGGLAEILSRFGKGEDVIFSPAALRSS